MDGVWPFLLNVKFHLQTNVLSKSYRKISKGCLLCWAYLVIVTLAERMERELCIETGKVYRLTGCVKFVYQLFSKLSRMFRGLDHRIHSLRMKHSKTLQSLLNINLELYDNNYYEEWIWQINIPHKQRQEPAKKMCTCVLRSTLRLRPSRATRSPDQRTNLDLMFQISMAM